MNTKLILPENIFSKIFLSEIKPAQELETNLSPSSLVVKRLNEDEHAVGLIPTMDLLNNKDLFVSGETGISFNALLSNSYIHFKGEQEMIDELFMKGDVSTNEVILSKILFKEFYDVDIQTSLLKSTSMEKDDNVLIVGDENFEKELFLNGLSFAEEIIELINAPYVNFVLCSTSEDAIKNFVRSYKDNLTEGHPDNLKDMVSKLPQNSLDFISVNIQHVIFDFDEQDLEGIKSLLQMPYYHGMIKEMIDVKFV